MASIIEDVLKATVGLLFKKCLDLVVDSLPEGDVAEQKFRNMIVREIDDTKSKLDGLVRKDLLTSISLFKELCSCIKCWILNTVVRRVQPLNKEQSHEDQGKELHNSVCNHLKLR